jgi:DNA-directed RNA polymerase specialized sigma subunit
VFAAFQCLTQEEIADKVSLSHNRISEIIGKFKSELSDKINLVPESLQLCSVWK